MGKWIVSLLAFSVSMAHAAPARRAGPATSGYVDAQFQWNHGSLDLTGAPATEMPGDSTGFVLNQGAFMFTDEFSGAEMTVDIPFRGNTKKATATSQPGTTSSELEL